MVGTHFSRKRMSAFGKSELYRNILESLPTGLCVVDLEKKIIVWSNGAERIINRISIEGHTDMVTGNFRPTVPIPPGASCRPTESAPTK